MTKTKIIFILALVALIFGCTAKKKQPATRKLYFNMTAFFEQEAKKLQQKNPTVLKKVSKDKFSEQKTLKIKNWGKELKPFMEADINKAAWVGEFKITQANALTTYTSTNAKIPVKKLIIAKQGNSVLYIQAIVHNINFLYSTKDTLTYYPHKFYEWRKTQKIKLFAPVAYQIKGQFKDN